MAKLLLLTDAYPPESCASAYLMRVLAQFFSVHGTSVEVITCRPKFNVPGGIADGRCGSAFDGAVRVLRVPPPPIHKAHPVVRGLGEIILALLFLLRGVLVRGVDVIVCYTPPLTLGLTAYALSRIKRVPFVMDVHDIFPQYAVDIGVLKNRAVIHCFEMLEQFLYKKADHLMVTCEGNKSLVCRRGACADRVTVMPHWVDIKPQAPEPSVLIEEYRLQGKFIALFGGVLGYQQDFDVIINAAARLANEQDICFLIAGDGSEKPRLLRLVQEKNLTNVIFSDYLDPEQYWGLLHSVHVGLATLRHSVGLTVVPSKINAYMACGKPVITVIRGDSDCARLIHESDAGFVCAPGDSRALADAILKLSRDRDLYRQMGLNGTNYAQKYFRKEVVLGEYSRVIHHVIQGSLVGTAVKSSVAKVS